MFAGATLLGLHMALTHSLTVSMVSAYMPTGEVPGIGKLSGTAVSFTDFLLGEPQHSTAGHACRERSTGMRWMWHAHCRWCCTAHRATIARFRRQGLLVLVQGVCRGCWVVRCQRLQPHAMCLT